PLLKAERVAMNFLCHLSGVATLTRCFVKAVEGTNCRILDTRKTLPGLRAAEKEAVLHGGGFNHRRNLSEAVLIKENHILLAGSLSKAVQRIKEQGLSPIRVEVKTLEEVKEAIHSDVHAILLDNMSLEEMEKAIKIIPSTITIEASGNMNLERVKKVARLGVHEISIGALTHSAPFADISFLFEKLME
ncbi:MAG: carboxylating nicotinate-nucleotide diphosphorylase, partial [Bdellovibrio sp.]